MSNLDSIFAPTAINPRERITKWAELKKNGIGSKVGGKFLGYYIKPPEGKFKAQCVVILEDLDTPTDVWGVSLPEYYKNDVQLYQKGDRVGYIYDRDIPAKEKGMSDTKHIQAYNQDHQDRLAANIKVEAAAPETEVEASHDEETDINDLVQ